MRSPDDVYQEIEADRALRESEIRLIENIVSRAENNDERSMLLRSLVLLTYAHFEGFCKFSLASYTSAINALKLPCREAAVALVAASLGRVFAALRDINSKHPELGSALPNDRELHLLARERAFIERYEAIVTERVEVPDSVVDTRSNLNSVVLKRNMYQLGLEYPAVDKHSGTINRLLGIRNAIAHGDLLKVPKPGEAREYVDASFQLMRFVQEEVYSALRDERYRRNPDQVR